MRAMRRILLTIPLALALCFAACKKEKPTSGKPENKPEPAQPAQPAEPAQPAAKAGDDMEVKAPTAADLDRFTKDLEGKGPLTATIETSLGTIHCQLAGDKAPLTVASFVGLARGLQPFLDPATNQPAKRPFFDGLVFHRVIPGFMIQGGDPLGTGTGGPGYEFATEVSDALKHDRAGTLSMANAGPDTNGSQFFITDKATPQLDGSYNVFGYCKETDVVHKIATVPAGPGADGEMSKPNDPPKILHVTISLGEPAAATGAAPAGGKGDGEKAGAAPAADQDKGKKGKKPKATEAKPDAK
jgi:peptidyl-prolyl cis-trans isomerase A (cyclophilin A)